MATGVEIGAVMSGLGALGSAFGGSEQHDPAATSAYWQNRADQFEFAKHGIQWRVEDAMAAGLHPLSVLGASGASYSPPSVTVGSEPDRVSRIGSALQGMGQSVERAAASTKTVEQKMADALTLESLRQRVRKEGYEADILEGQARSSKLGVSQVGPGMPGPISGGDVFGHASDYAYTSPAGRISADSDDSSLTAAASSPMWERFTMLDADGRYREVVLPSSGRGTPTEALESLAENYAMMYLVGAENLKRNPELAYNMRHLWPGGEMASDIARALERASQYYLNQSKARAALRRDMHIWNKAGRERGVNWRSGR